MEGLEKMVAIKGPCAATYPLYPEFTLLRGEPRLNEMRRKQGLPEIHEFPRSLSVVDRNTLSRNVPVPTSAEAVATEETEDTFLRPRPRPASLSMTSPHLTPGAPYSS